ncbi:MAG: hypothetical protein COV91_01530 [Candidatus Taylorbacteria bacterium CG11_big_fil_rev_8_21_14_0_20_46_11]|uniref:Uncharacterized protein n=1 Tax=Candidatus Taylorbacteria bacterium CG11_big_fil_rev_8_21_14_0_20_46_11 TaxID=1975025 RepID=A0A2H0KCF4_9BACT|nr:MAG: hypothetical protein COV91_01530 [Candidatus Taylorbacteria bacterium CG11_big_fil_rev_8_21_14_0_20_46_11]
MYVFSSISLAFFLLRDETFSSTSVRSQLADIIWMNFIRGDRIKRVLVVVTSTNHDKAQAREAQARKRQIRYSKLLRRSATKEFRIYW